MKTSLRLVAFLAGGAVVAWGQTTSRVSVDSAGVQGNSHSGDGSISADGRFVAFLSSAWNLVPGDSNLAADIFVHDRATGSIERVSVNSAGVDSFADSWRPSISADGRFVAFTSDAAEFVAADTNDTSDVFVHDRVFHLTERVSVGPPGFQANSESGSASISANGRFVAFTSAASNLVPGDTNLEPDIFVHDRATHTTERMSVSSTGVQANDGCGEPSISANGRLVFFSSFASNLVPMDTNRWADVFVHDRASGTTERVSLSSLGLEGNFSSFYSANSADGRFVCFMSGASNLVPGDTNNNLDMFVRDRFLGTTELVSVSSAGVQASLVRSLAPSISADGRFVCFMSPASNLVPGDTNQRDDIFVHDRASRTTVRVSADSAGVQGNDHTWTNSLSGDGRFVAFGSSASNFVPGDTNGSADAFVRELRDPSACSAGTVNGNFGSLASVLSINASAGDANRVVALSQNTPIQVALNASPAGPGGPGNSVARYGLWIWSGFPSNPLDFIGTGGVLGCTVNPTPLRPLAAPQPTWCLSTPRLGSALCQGVNRSTAPSRAPWVTNRSLGFSRPVVLTMQGILQDNGATNASGYSVTNAVILQVR